jgi:chemotaxis protein histidine kinase CheA
VVLENVELPGWLFEGEQAVPEVEAAAAVAAEEAVPSAEEQAAAEQAAADAADAEEQDESLDAVPATELAQPAATELAQPAAEEEEMQVEGAAQEAASQRQQPQPQAEAEAPDSGEEEEGEEDFCHLCGQSGEEWGMCAGGGLRKHGTWLAGACAAALLLSSHALTIPAPHRPHMQTRTTSCCSATRATTPATCRAASRRSSACPRRAGEGWWWLGAGACVLRIKTGSRCSSRRQQPAGLDPHCKRSLVSSPLASQGDWFCIECAAKQAAAEATAAAANATAK